MLNNNLATRYQKKIVFGKQHKCPTRAFCATCVQKQLGIALITVPQAVDALMHRDDLR
jgi:hypothetical protein